MQHSFELATSLSCAVIEVEGERMTLSYFVEINNFSGGDAIMLASDLLYFGNSFVDTGNGTTVPVTLCYLENPDNVEETDVEVLREQGVISL